MHCQPPDRPRAPPPVRRQSTCPAAGRPACWQRYRRRWRQTKATTDVSQQSNIVLLGQQNNIGPLGGPAINGSATRTVQPGVNLLRLYNYRWEAGTWSTVHLGGKHRTTGVMSVRQRCISAHCRRCCCWEWRTGPRQPAGCVPAREAVLFVSPELP